MLLRDDVELIARERLFALGLVIFIILSRVFDIYEDLAEGCSLSHVVSEGIIVVVCLAAAIYIWRQLISGWKRSTRKMINRVEVVSADAEKWKAAHQTLSKGITNAINSHLDGWGLSPAEKDIALLLIKGLSFKEVAAARNTSEHTVRQQAATIYRKSGLDGRSQLSAFFLEGLLDNLAEN